MSFVEAKIINRVIAPERASLAKKVAEAILALGFNETDRRRMDKLAKKAQEGSLSPQERLEAESYERVGHFLSLLKSKARRSIGSAKS